MSPVTNGELSGTAGQDRLAFLRGVVVFMTVVAVITVINVLTIQHDMHHLDWWEPWTWEGSSALALACIIWLPWLTLKAAPPEAWRKPMTWLIHLGGLLAWSVLHVGGFLLIRHTIYALHGQTYDYGDLRAEFPYELRKDILSYTMAVATFWLSAKFVALREAAPVEPAPPALFDIRDGAKVIRVPVADILAAASAGNYVEFHLADGRKPLMRAALSAVEGELAAPGFVRTHRSWLVNAARVTGLKPAGSGDYTVELGALEVPLSRRFPEALARLRG
jgi:DNA-binding LytR/AlgR family response regulator